MCRGFQDAAEKAEEEALRQQRIAAHEQREKQRKVRRRLSCPLASEFPAQPELSQVPLLASEFPSSAQLSLRASESPLDPCR